MNDNEFVLLLQKTTQNDTSAIYEIIQMYEKLIIKNSYINGKYDSDCRAYIEMCLITAIKKSKNITDFCQVLGFSFVFIYRTGKKDTGHQTRTLTNTFLYRMS